jgi:hypothetical protein
VIDNNNSNNTSNDNDDVSCRIDYSRTVLRYFLKWPSGRLFCLTHAFPGSMTMDFLINNEGQLLKECLVSS